MAQVVVLGGVALAQPVDIPHLAYPFTITADGAVVVQQDSVEEVAACVAAICSFVEGEREDNPTFGIPSPLFAGVPIDTTSIRAALQVLEPRAALDIVESGDPFDASDRTITIEVSLNA